MQRNRVTDKVRATVETAIVELHAERELIDAELQHLIAMLKAIEPKKKPGKKPKKAKAVKRPTGKTALALLEKHDEVNPGMVAKRAGVSYNAAHQALDKLARAGTAKRLRRGIYARGK